MGIVLFILGAVLGFSVSVLLSVSKDDRWILNYVLTKQKLSAII